MTNFSVLKVAEGGSASQRELLRRLKAAKIPAEASHSPYVGHFGILVRTTNKRSLRKAEGIIFGRG